MHWPRREQHPCYRGKEENVIYVAFPSNDSSLYSRILHPQDLSNVVDLFPTPLDKEPQLRLAEEVPSLAELTRQPVSLLASLEGSVARYQAGVAQTIQGAQDLQVAALELQEIKGFSSRPRHWYSGLVRSYTLGGMAFSAGFSYALSDHFQSLFGARLYPSAVLVFGATVLSLFADVYRLDHARNVQQPIQQTTPSSSTEAPSACPPAQYPSRSTPF